MKNDEKIEFKDMNKKVKLMLGDNMESLKKIPDNSIDSIVSDPPYGLSFMGKKWDYDVPSVEFWKEVFRVLKPGGHILSFGGTRTYHRMVVNIEDAGFEIRDQIMWLYGSGFPKSHNIGKAVDKKEGNKREVVGTKNDFALDGRVRNTDIHKPLKETINADHTYGYKDGWNTPVTKGNSQYEGWGTALKPANEPICVARKPLSEPNVAANVMKWGTGGINVDGCRVGNEVRTTPIFSEDEKQDDTMLGLNSNIQHKREETTEGRFPANLIIECICDEVIKGDEIKGNENYKWNNVDSDSDIFKGRGKYTPRTETPDIHTNPECPCYILDQQSGTLKSGDLKPGHKRGSGVTSYDGGGGIIQKNYGGDKGGASRFFYNAKVSKAERNMGLDEFEDKIVEGRDEGQDERSVAYKPRPVSQKNVHPTVKPVALMSYLVRLVTPPNGIVLDPFMGSGSTGIASQLEGFRFVGCEMDEEYFKIASKRIEEWEKYKKFIK